MKMKIEKIAHFTDYDELGKFEKKLQLDKKVSDIVLKWEFRNSIGTYIIRWGEQQNTK